MIALQSLSFYFPDEVIEIWYHFFLKSLVEFIRDIINALCPLFGRVFNDYATYLVDIDLLIFVDFLLCGPKQMLLLRNWSISFRLANLWVWSFLCYLFHYPWICTETCDDSLFVQKKFAWRSEGH